MTAPIPLRIGNYKLKKTLGTGTFAKVKLGQNEISNHLVAVKVANKKKMQALGMQEKVMREIRVLQSLSHPNIVKLFECIDTKSDIFIVTEYCPNGDLFDHISSQGKLSEVSAKKIFC